MLRKAHKGLAHQILTKFSVKWVLYESVSGILIGLQIGAALWVIRVPSLWVKECIWQCHFPIHIYHGWDNSDSGIGIDPFLGFWIRIGMESTTNGRPKLKLESELETNYSQWNCNWNRRCRNYAIRPFKIDCVFCIKIISKSYARGRKHSTTPEKSTGLFHCHLALQS